MITLYDSLLLANTKLRTRKIRLTITIIISSLLFAGLAFLAVVSDGAISSFQSFGKEGYGGRYFVQAMPIAASGMPDEQKLTEQLKPIQTNLVAQKKAAAKRLNITYDETTDQALPIVTQKPTQGQTFTYINYGSPLVNKASAAMLRETPGIGFSDFTKLVTASGGTKTYRSTMSNGFSAIGSSASSLSVLTDGKEPVPLDTQKAWQNGPKGLETITTLGWHGTDGELIIPFLLEGQTVAVQKDGVLPIIAPFSAAEEILKLKSLPDTATPEQKLERLSTVRKQVAGKTAQLCYRNAASSTLYSNAVQQQKEIDANKGKKDYIKPALIYQLPTTACGPTTIASDKRTADEKKQASNQETFDRQFNGLTDPEQGLITVRVAGISPDLNAGPTTSATAILASLFSSSLGTGWISPNEAFSSNDFAQKFQGGKIDDLSLNLISYYAEFPSLKTMEAFIKQQTCDSTDVMSTVNGPVIIGNGQNPSDTCAKQGKLFSVSPYGNSAGAIEQFRTSIWKVARFVILAIVVIAALIMMGNVGKIIADSRRETAVFRALGAKRLDISQIYVTYVILIGLLVSACAIIIGIVGALWVNSHFSPSLSVSAVITYNASDITKQFSLFGINPLHLGVIVGLAVLSGLISAILPLLTNMHRNPIRDMRDDT